MGTSASRDTRRGDFFGDWFSTESFVAGKGAEVLAGVEEGDVVLVLLVSEVVFCRLVFQRSNRDRVDTRPISVRAVLPHGNSAGDVRKEVSYCGIYESLL